VPHCHQTLPIVFWNFLLDAAKVIFSFTTAKQVSTIANLPEVRGRISPQASLADGFGRKTLLLFLLVMDSLVIVGVGPPIRRAGSAEDCLRSLRHSSLHDDVALLPCTLSCLIIGPRLCILFLLLLAYGWDIEQK